MRKIIIAAVLFSCCQQRDAQPPTREPLPDSLVIIKSGTVLSGHGDTIKYLKIQNASDITVTDLVIIGGGAHVVATENVKNITLEKIHSTGAETGLTIWSEGAGSIENITVTDSRFFSNAFAGIYAGCEWPKILNKNITIHKVDACDNFGKKDQRPHTGHGIVINGFDGGTITRCRAWNNGYLFGHGNIGIWCYDARNLLFEYNESVFNKSVTGTDGGGMDIDGGSSGIIMRNNYTQGNTGAGFLLYEYGSPNPMENNIFENNTTVQDGTHKNYSSFSLGGMPGTVVKKTVLRGNLAQPLTGKQAVTYFNQSALDGVLFENNSWQ